MGGNRSENEEEREKRPGGRKVGGHSKKEFVPPDGGYGWVIVVSTGLANFCILPMAQNFGLIYKDSFERWGITTAEYSVIMNLQFSVCNGVGLIMGPLLKTYTYRTVTLWGVSMVSLSAVLTSQVNKFYQFLLIYSILGGLGIGMVWIATSIAINTFFKARRGVATGFAWAATGISPVVFPYLVTWLTGCYDVHGTVLIVSAIMMHSIPAAMLLHPVEWHAELKDIDEEEQLPLERITTNQDGEEESNKLVELQEVKDWGRNSRSGISNVSETARSRRESPNRHSLNHPENGDILVDTQETLGLEVALPVSLHSSRVSLENVGLSSKHPKVSEGEHENGKDISETPDEGRKKKKSTFRRVVEYFDLNLLSDPSFLMIFIGMTLAYGGEINFSLLTPFVFLDYGLPMGTVAMFLSALASVDLITRFTMPFLSDHFKLDARFMFSIGLIMLATGRIMLTYLSALNAILFTSLWIGMGKGFRTIYMALILPSVVPLEKLPSASGLQTLANGVFFFTMGPLFGYIRDNSANYVMSLYAINVFSFSAIFLWIMEVIYTRHRERSKERNKTNNKRRNRINYTSA